MSTPSPPSEKNDGSGGTIIPPSSQKPIPKKYLLLSYLLGVTWVLLHPIASITTGEFKCRGTFMDEHAFLLEYFPTADPNRFFLEESSIPATSSFCSIASSLEISCYTIDDISVAAISPTKSQTVPTESIAIIVSPPGEGKTWWNSHFHKGLLELMSRLSSAPWLTKTILFVTSTSPSSSSSSLSLTKLSRGFIQLLSPPPGRGRHQRASSPLSPKITSLILRHAICLEVTTAPARSNSKVIRVLPQGRHGNLPNLDYAYGYLRTVRSAVAVRKVSVELHAFAKVLTRWKARVPHGVGVPGWYVDDLLGMVGFMGSMVLGARPPHSPFLEVGIDSFSVQARLPSSDMTVMHVSLEHFMRGLSNLEERLHHSVVQYLLLSTKKFVSNGEYIYPTLLLLLPAVIVGLELAMRGGRRGWGVTWLVVKVMWGICALPLTLLSTVITVSPMAYTANYTGCLLLLQLQIRDQQQYMKTTQQQITQRLQFLACACLVYTHVPLLLTNISLALPSTLLFSPLVVTALSSKIYRVTRLLMMIILLLTLPPLFLVPKLFGGYTLYVLALYTPMHLLLTTLWLL